MGTGEAEVMYTLIFLGYTCTRLVLVLSRKWGSCNLAIIVFRKNCVPRNMTFPGLAAYFSMVTFLRSNRSNYVHDESIQTS